MIAGIHHVALRTRDVARLEAFYAGALGLAVEKADDGRSVWLRAGEVILMLERADEGEPAPSPRSMEMVAFAITPDKRAEYMLRLERAGFPPEGQTAYSIYVRDPDGRRVGLSHYPHPPNG